MNKVIEQTDRFIVVEDIPSGMTPEQLMPPQQVPTDREGGLAFICSVYPMALISPEYPWEGLKRHYEIPAPPADDGYSVLIVHNSFQNIMDTSVPDAHQYISRIIPAWIVKDTLVQHWGGDIVVMEGMEGGAPGIGGIAKMRPTDAELAKLHRQQNYYLQALIQEAMNYHQTDEPKKITARHRRALRWMKMDDPEIYPWYTPLTPQEHRKCPACGGSIPATATRCKHCKEDVGPKPKVAGALKAA